ncbi:MAG: helix-turn-helix domain-containing protein [Lachnospiraceae bacterium]|nr:helix-turn-helix domain-containing protein [Lachnospiraceae bacterium]
MNTSDEPRQRNVIGEKLRALRTKEGVSQKILAARLQTEGLNVSDLIILRIENGTRYVHDYEVAAIAKHYKISTDELLGLNDTGAKRGTKNV